MGQHSSEQAGPFRGCAASSVRTNRGAQAPNALRDQVLDILRTGELEMVYQPAVRLDAPRVEFFEALARFNSPLCQTPGDWFAAAAEVGLGADLEMLAVKCALEGFSVLPEGSAISVNVSLSTILSPGFADHLLSTPLDRILLEITEKQAAHSYEAIIEKLEPLRARGLRVAVDDAGAGYSSFRHILQIRPDVIKLDMSICRGIHEDHMRRALVSALICFARQTGSDLVAEGVETMSELKSLRALGMTIIQGHIFARPMSPERISTVALNAPVRPEPMPRWISKAA